VPEKGGKGKKVLEGRRNKGGSLSSRHLSQGEKKEKGAQRKKQNPPTNEIKDD